jgi:protein TonB
MRTLSHLVLVSLSAGALLASPTFGQSKKPVAIDTPATVIKQVAPYYPELAQKAGIEGNVFVLVHVDTAGMPTKVEIYKSDNEVLNQSALEAAKQWRFSPAKVDGHPVEVIVTIPIRYRLADKKAK